MDAVPAYQQWWSLQLTDTELRIDSVVPGGGELKKLVVHTFLGMPLANSITHYLEFCGNSDIALEISAGSDIEVSDSTGFYHDTRASDAMFDSYTLVDPISGRHIQLIGGDRLLIVPQSPKITSVSPEIRSSQRCFKISVSHVEGNEKNLSKMESNFGSWIRVKQPEELSWQGVVNNQIALRIATKNLRVTNFYWFVSLPRRFRAVAEDLRIEASPMRPSEAEPQSVMEFVLPANFAVYTEWSPRAHEGSWLKNRRSIRLQPNRSINLKFRAIDDAYSSRLSTTSFLSGVGLALGGNALVSSVFLGLEQTFSIALIVTLIALSTVVLLTAWISFRALTRRR